MWSCCKLSSVCSFWFPHLSDTHVFCEGECPDWGKGATLKGRDQLKRCLYIYILLHSFLFPSKRYWSDGPIMFLTSVLNWLSLQPIIEPCGVMWVQHPATSKGLQETHKQRMGETIFTHSPLPKNCLQNGCSGYLYSSDLQQFSVNLSNYLPL